MQTSKRCDSAWPNNDGGLWCNRYPREVPEGACDQCRCQYTVRHVRPMCETPLMRKEADDGKD